MILLQHCLNAEPPGEEWRYYPLFCDMRIGNWVHGKTQAVPAVSSYTVLTGSSRLIAAHVSKEPVTKEKRKKGWRMSCDVGKATEGLENEL